MIKCKQETDSCRRQSWPQLSENKKNPLKSEMLYYEFLYFLQQNLNFSSLRVVFIALLISFKGRI